MLILLGKNLFNKIEKIEITEKINMNSKNANNNFYFNQNQIETKWFYLNKFLIDSTISKLNDENTIKSENLSKIDLEFNLEK